MDLLARAQTARRILDDPLFIEARQHVEGQLAQLRRSVPISATEMHTRIILMGQLWESLTDFFEQLAQSGKLEQLRLDQEERKRSLLAEGIAMFRRSGRGGL